MSSGRMKKMSNQTELMMRDAWFLVEGVPSDERLREALIQDLKPIFEKFSELLEKQFISDLKSNRNMVEYQNRRDGNGSSD